MIGGLGRGDRVRIDGQAHGAGTFAVPAGKHVVVLVVSGAIRQTDSVKLRPGETLSWKPRAVKPEARSLAAEVPPPPPAPRPVARPSRPAGPTCQGAVQAEQWDDAVTLCTKEAKAGHAAAQRSLGELFERGRGVTRSDVDAVTWYTKAADGGDRDAMFRVAVAYEKGHGVKKDGATALIWYSRAAEAGLADAQFTVGQAYEKGKLGAHKDKVMALHWYKLAAAQGHKSAADRVKELEK